MNTENTPKTVSVYHHILEKLAGCWLSLCFTSRINSKGHVGTVSTGNPNHTVRGQAFQMQVANTKCPFLSLLHEINVPDMMIDHVTFVLE